VKLIPNKLLHTEDESREDYNMQLLTP